MNFLQLTMESNDFVDREFPDHLVASSSIAS